MKQISNTTSLPLNSAGTLVPIIPVTCYRVNKAIADVGMIDFHIWTWNIEYYKITGVPDSHIGTHLARVTAYTLCG